MFCIRKLWDLKIHQTRLDSLSVIPLFYLKLSYLHLINSISIFHFIFFIIVFTLFIRAMMCVWARYLRPLCTVLTDVVPLSDPIHSTPPVLWPITLTLISIAPPFLISLVRVRCRNTTVHWEKALSYLNRSLSCPILPCPILSCIVSSILD